MRLYNTLSRAVEEIVPVDGRLVRIYSCGPTVYRYIHIGNMRSFMLGDLIRRALRFEGLDVRWIMNITDVGHMTDEVSDTGRDKMELAESDEGLSAAEIAEKYTQAFLEDADLVGIERADLYPRATDHIPEMISMIETLIEKGHAYEVDGTVYYETTTFPGYGKLSGNTLDQLRAGHRTELATDPGKRHPEDFALWKKAGANRLLRWPSPWGDGYPGWHIECSAMSIKHLGDSLRRAHRGQRQQVPAPRGRDRAVGGRRRSSGRVDLGTRWVPADGWSEDGEIREEHQAGDRSGRAGHRPPRLPVVHVPDPVSIRDGLHLGGTGDGRSSRQAAPEARRRVGRAGRRPRPSREGVRLHGSARPSRTTSTCRPPSVS